MQWQQTLKIGCRKLLVEKTAQLNNQNDICPLDSLGDSTDFKTESQQALCNVRFSGVRRKKFRWGVQGYVRPRRGSRDGEFSKMWEKIS